MSARGKVDSVIKDTLMFHDAACSVMMIFLTLAFMVGTAATAQVPSNDTCTNAQIITAPGLYPGTTAGATPSAGLTCGPGPDVWYSYTATGTGNRLYASTCPPGSSSFLSVVEILTGSCANPNPFQCSGPGWCEYSMTASGGRALVPTTTAGVLYLIRVSGSAASESGAFSLYVNEIPVASQPNGTCASAQPVTDGITRGSNFGEPSVGLPGFSQTCQAGFSDVFFSYTAATTGVRIVRTCLPAGAPFPSLHIRSSLIAVFPSCQPATAIACNGNGCAGNGPNGALAAVQFPTTAGMTYLIRVTNFNSSAGEDGYFYLDISPPPPPVNDDCASAISLSSGTNGPFSNESATDSIGYAASCGGGAIGSKDVFFSYTPPCSSSTTFSTGCNGFDTILSVYDMCSGTQLACNDNAGGGCGNSSSATITTIGFATYVIRVASKSTTQFGQFNLNITPGFSLCWNAPLGPGSIRFSMFGGPPNGTYSLFLTGFAGAFPNGWFLGIDISIPEILAQASFGPPLTGQLGGTGFFISPTFVGIPSGLTIYSVAVGMPPGSSTPSAATGPAVFTTP